MDAPLAMFEKVCHDDNLFSVSYKRELRKSFFVPDFTTVMSSARVWYVNRKRISRRLNLYIAHLLHFYESINNKFSNILKTWFSLFLIVEFWLTGKNRRLKPRNVPASRYFFHQIEIYKFNHFPAGTTNSVKIPWGVSSWLCVMVTSLTLHTVIKKSQ